MCLSCGLNRRMGERMSRIQGHVFTDKPFGRLVLTNPWVFEPDYDAGEKIAMFVIPSHSRGNSRTYGVELDYLTGEIACACEWFESKMKTNAGRDKYGTYLEHRCKAVTGKRLLPLITRKPKGMCWHCQAVRRWVKRHKHFEYFLLRIEQLEGRLDEIEQRKTA